MTWYLVFFDLLITIGSVLSIGILVIYAKTRNYKNKPLFRMVVNVLSVMLILTIITFVYAGIAGYGKTFDSFSNMRPLTGPLRQSGISFLYFLISLPMYLFMIARILYFVYDTMMSPEYVTPNKKGSRAVSLTQQNKDEAERFGRGKDFK